MSVTPDPSPASIEPWEVLDLLAGLVQKSLVVYEEDAQGAGRYRLLEMVWQYARDRLPEAGEAAQTRDRHLSWCLALAERAEPELLGPHPVLWFERLDREHCNLRAALDWSKAAGSPVGEGAEAPPSLGLRLAGALWWFWALEAHFREGSGHLEELLRTAGEAVPAAARAKALLAAGDLAWSLWEMDRSKARVEAGLELFRSLGDESRVALALSLLAQVAERQKDDEQATWLYEQSVEFARRVGDDDALSRSLDGLGMIAERQAQYQRAAALFDETLALARRRNHPGESWLCLYRLAGLARREGDLARVAALLEESLTAARQYGVRVCVLSVTQALGEVLLRMGEHERAAELLEESLTLSRGLNLAITAANCMRLLGEAAVCRGDLAQAMTYCQESLHLCRKKRDASAAADCLELAAVIGSERCHYRAAARLLGAGAALRERAGVSLLPDERTRVEQAGPVVRAALDRAAFAAAWAEGGAMSLDRAVDLALSELAATTPDGA